MKKLVAMLAVSAVVSVASADITQFRFNTGSALDQGVATDNWTMLFVGGTSDAVSGIISGGQVDIADLAGLGLSVLGAEETAKLVFEPTGTLKTEYVYGDETLAGDMFGLLVNKTGVASFADIAEGDFVGMTTANYVIEDLRPGGDGTTTSLPQDFAAGTVDATVEVIPEPATIGLMGIAGLGLFLARRKARR